MKTIGLIGGTSWHSTIVYYRLINEMVSETIGSDQNPPIWIHSLNIDLMRRHNKAEINEKYLEVAQKLEQNGSDAIAICANTPHMVYPYVQPQISIPILHIADATGKVAWQEGLKKLGLLGNRPTMTGDFIPLFLQSKFNIETLIPAEEFIDPSHDYVSKELTQGKFTNEATDFYLDQINRLESRGADGIILGCTELPMLLGDEAYRIPLLPTTQLHARMIADFILSE
ncbi:amino acid racemase [Membranicola marinus]|uniref:Amino acid racemase n=1 Tax=Membranihabitans marinus TaxID=1227546 RepID=A0A953LCZ7_9BACT|nr:amino acid racemase [Membranihabitans marinus]MBY5958319.1 amino acid racemase [Membranihabitans marinus]